MNTLNTNTVINNKLDIGENMKNILKSQTINLHEIPAGKHSFIATVKDFQEEESVDYHEIEDFIPYIYFKDVKMLINDQWVNVECSGNDIRSKIGTRLGRLNLVKGDVVSFNAQVEDGAIEFEYIEGKDTIDPNEFYNEPFAILPISYKSTIFVYIYETEFIGNFRLSKNNYFDSFEREEFEKAIKTLNVKRKTTKKHDGYFREVQNMYFNGKRINRLSNIKKLYSSNEGCA